MAPKRFTAEDVLRETLVTQLAVAPDGSAAVYARRTIESGQYRTRLWRVPMTRGRAERITSGDLDTRPRFSPDGKTLLFLSTRSGHSQPWLLPLSGGERPSWPNSEAASAPRSGHPTVPACSHSPRAARTASSSVTAKALQRGTSAI